MINSLLKNLKKQYKKHNIYVFTKPEYFCFIDDNPHVHKLMQYNPAIENSFVMEGAGEGIMKDYLRWRFIPIPQLKKIFLSYIMVLINYNLRYNATFTKRICQKFRG